ncbi:MAG TPA: glycoside hydrolase family 2 TIM barrel-domain containing protein [Bryobacteraceae bacterium]|nr:glycoside hydrolase family 2 TIM barrel-domain containing protein [Bryobacteraceae bacterium]
MATRPPHNSRRDFLRSITSATAALSLPAPAATRGPARRTLNLDQDWFFNGNPITLPHCVAPLSWQKWDPTAWERVWRYRRQFALPADVKGLRLFLHFDGVMIAACPELNGHALPEHLGGFLPFQYEITDLVNPKKNVLVVAVDSRWKSIPPEGSPKGPGSIDYLLPGGITGSVTLRAMPQVFISDVFARSVDVLRKDRRLEIQCSVDAAALPASPIRLIATLRRGSQAICRASKDLVLEKSGETQTTLILTDLQGIDLWDVDAPHLYDLQTELLVGGKVLHDYRTRVGFREARFALDGFFLNGRRLQLFGLNRHELYPYVGRSMPRRVLRGDARILRREFNCNVVRCSHYPQSEAFLDACDELGLMVWEEIPGWQYLGDENWRDLAVRDVRDMVRRDRNHPSIVIWGFRINESHNDPALYHRTKQAAKSLDDSRPTSGSMVYHSTHDWFQDVFAFDDYHARPDGSVGLVDPLPGVPFFFSEAVGQFNYAARHGFDVKYRRTGDLRLQQKQAILHAQVHDRGLSDRRYCGVIAWCGFDYGSLLNSYQGVKYPGVADVFRIPKLGAAFYLAQVDPDVRPVIEPAFYWDFGPQSPSGPGEHAAIFSNCERLELLIDGHTHSTLHPDRTAFPRIKYPPFFADLKIGGSGKPELRIDGYVGARQVLSRSFSADPVQDQFLLHAGDRELLGDGADATRLLFKVVDKFGAPRAFAGGEVSFRIDGPGILVGDNPFNLADAGGAGAVWVKAKPNGGGQIAVEAQHSRFGKKSVQITVRPL